MPTSPTNPLRATLNRSGLRQASSAAPALQLPGAARPAAPVETFADDLRYFLKAVTWMSLGLAGVVGLFATGLMMHDSMAAGAALAEAKKEHTTLVCQAGHMAHGDGSLHDLVFESAYFVCTDWKTLQAIELEQKPGK